MHLKSKSTPIPTLELLFGKIEEFSLEHRLLNITTFTFFVLSMLYCPFAFFTDIHKRVVLLSILSVILSYTAYFLSRINKNFKISARLFYLSLLFILSINWFIHGGSFGPSIYLFFAAFIIVLLIFDKDIRTYAIIILFCNIFFLFMAEYLYPKYINLDTHNDPIRLIDLYIVFTIAIVLINLSVIYLKDRYEEEKEKFSKSEKKYKTLFDESKDVIFLADVNTGIILEANKAAAKLLGKPLEKIIGIHQTELHPKEELIRYGQIFKEHIQSEENYAVEVEVVDINDKKIPVEINSSIIHLAEGIKVNQGIFRDISERKKYDNDLKNSEKRYKDLFEGITDAVFVINQKGIIIDCNNAVVQQLNYEKNEIIGTPVQKIASDNIRNQVYDLIKNAFINGKAFFEAEHINKEGSIIPVEINVNIVDYSGEKAILAVARDISERKKLQMHLAHIQKLEAIGTLAGGIAHNFNNALFPIMGYAEMILDISEDKPEIKNYVNEVLIAANKAKELVDQVLVFAQKDVHDKTQLWPYLIINETLKMLKPLLPANIELIANLYKGKDNILANPVQIQQMLINLCTNASHSMAEKGGKIEVISNKIKFNDDDVKADPIVKEGDYLQIRIKDTGHGMDKFVMEKLFEPYFTTKPVGQGTGLGLSFVHGTVKSYNGFIKVESAPNKGAIFDIYLPLKKIEPVEIKNNYEKNFIKGTETILIVDDDENILNLEKEILIRMGYSVEALLSSFQALNIFSKSPDKFDLIIADLDMPELNGIELSKKILDIKPNIPIIICTGLKNYHISLEDLQKIGIKECIIKPVSKAEIGAKIRKVLDLKSS
ncbi:MAG: PAS domain S-box protein [Desulfobacterales bacterium]|nr:PAS domain S-box protein [Desulfobacterales bacterium]